MRTENIIINKLNLKMNKLKPELYYNFLALHAVNQGVDKF